MALSLDSNDRKEIALHLGIILAITALLLLGFFYFYLPYATNHNQTVTVPDLKGMDAREVADFLAERELDVAIEDSSFNPSGKPFAIFNQFPAPGAKVKKGRKIFISINSLKPPLTKMPDLLNRSLSNATQELTSLGLLLGEVTYRHDIQQNAVLEQMYEGKVVRPGEMVPKGAKIFLVVGDGLGATQFSMPDLSGKSLEEVQILLEGSKLQTGTILYDASASEPLGTIVKQKPEAGIMVNEGQSIDLWISGQDPAGPSTADE